MPKRTEKKPDTHGNRQIVGVSLDPAMARSFKSEAAERGLSLRKLFEEMWTLYKRTKS
jgi:hypothetical protein